MADVRSGEVMAERRSVCLSVRCLLVYCAAVDLACNHDT